MAQESLVPLDEALAELTGDSGAPESEFVSAEEAAAELTGGAPATIGEGLQQASSKLAKGFIGTGTTAVKSAGLAAEAIGSVAPLTGLGVAGKEVREFAENVAALAETALPEIERLRDSFLLSTGPEAVGSAAGFLLPGGWLKAAGVPAWASTMALGSAVQSAAQFEDARMSGASEEDQWKAYLLGAGLGLTEAIPLSRILNRADKASGGQLRAGLIHGLIEGGEEFLQEAGSTMASNAIAADILQYDSDRKLMHGVLDAGKAGGFAGVILSALGTASAHSRFKQRGSATMPGGGEGVPEVPPAPEGEGGVLPGVSPAVRSEPPPDGTGEGATEGPGAGGAPAGAGAVPPVSGPEGGGALPEGGGAPVEGGTPGGTPERAGVEPEGADAGAGVAVPATPPGEGSSAPTPTAARRRYDLKLTKADERAEAQLEGLSEGMAAAIVAKKEGETDPLTGLFNRRGDERWSRRIINYAQSTGRRPVRVFVDLRDLTALNNIFSHDFADKVIVDFVNEWKALSRKGDVVASRAQSDAKGARVGGDEFAGTLLVNHDTDMDALVERIEKAADKVLRKYGLDKGAQGRIFGADAGWADIDVGEGDPIRALERSTHEADEMSKQRKRERVPGKAKLSNAEFAAMGPAAEAERQERLKQIAAEEAAAPKKPAPSAAKPDRREPEGARFFAAKFGLTAEEARRLAQLDKGTRDRLLEEHEKWREEAGLPAPNSSLARGDLLERLGKTGTTPAAPEEPGKGVRPTPVPDAGAAGLKPPPPRERAAAKPAPEAVPPRGKTEKLEPLPSEEMARDAIKQAKTGQAFTAVLIRGQGKKVSPYTLGAPQEAVLGPGLYTTPDRKYAEHFGPTITEHVVDLSNPLVVDDDRQWRKLTREAGWEYPNPYGSGDKASQWFKDLRALIESRGHDGVIVRLGPYDDTKTMRNVFGADQVVEFKKQKPRLGTPSERASAFVKGFALTTLEPVSAEEARALDRRIEDIDQERKLVEGNIEALNKKWRRVRAPKSVGEVRNKIEALKRHDQELAEERANLAESREQNRIRHVERRVEKELRGAGGMAPLSPERALVHIADISSKATEARAQQAAGLFRELVTEELGARKLPASGPGSMDWLVGELFDAIRQRKRGSLSDLITEALGVGAAQAKDKAATEELEAARKEYQEAEGKLPSGATGRIPGVYNLRTPEEKLRHAAELRGAAARMRATTLEAERAKEFASVERFEKRKPWDAWNKAQKNPIKITVWGGGMTPAEHPDWTNGRLLIAKKQAAKLKKDERAVLDRNVEGFTGRPPNTEVVWKDAGAAATTPITPAFVLEVSFGDHTEDVLVLYSPTGKVHIVNAAYAALLTKATQADAWFGAETGTHAIVLKRGGTPVAALMPISFKDSPWTEMLGTSTLEADRLVQARRAELEKRYPTQAEDAGLVEQDEDIPDDPGDGGVVADPSELPVEMQLEPPIDPILGGGANIAGPIGDRLLGQLEPAPESSGPLVSQPQIIEALSKVIAAIGGKTPIRWGRMGSAGKQSRGFFRVGPEVIRVKKANNVSTAGHEVGHALEKHALGWPKGGPWKAPLATKAMQEELVKLGRALYGNTKPAGGYKREGFAEFIRLYTMEPQAALSAAPKFHEWFETDFRKRHPKVVAQLLEVRRLADRWKAQGSLARADASIVEPTSLKERLKDARETYTLNAAAEALVEVGRPLNELAREAERRMGKLLTPSQDPFFMFQALRQTHSARVKQMVEEGMLDLAGNRVGPALAQIRPLVRGRYTNFVKYLWARRSIALLTDPRGKREPGLALEDAQHIVKVLGSPDFERAAQMVYDWNDGVLNYAAQASPEFAQAVALIRKRDPGSYIPLQREFSALDREWKQARGGPGAAGSGGVTQRLRGSGRRIKNPFPQMIAKAERTVLAAHRRAVFNAALRLSQVEGLGYLIEEVEVDKVPQNIPLERLIQKLMGERPELLNEEAATEALEDGDLAGEVLTFFQPAAFPKGMDPVLPVWRNGKVRWFAMDHRLARTMAGMDVYRLPWVVDLILGIPARMLRLGSTGLRASFGLITNPIRDIQTLWQNTKSHALAPRLFFEYLRAVGVSALHHVTGGKVTNPYTQAFLDLGAEMAQPLGQDMRHTARAARRLFQGRVARTIDPRNMLDTVRTLLQFPESGARVAELRLVAEEVGWKPGENMTMDQSLALLLAARQSTVDFAAAGWLSRVVNQIVPFHNAPIQGARASIRSASRAPGRWTFRGLQLTAATLALWWWNKDKDWYKEMTAKTRAMFWGIEYGDELLLIPRAHEGGVLFGSLPEALADAWYRQDPASAAAFFRELFDIWTPPVVPVPVQEAVEQFANRDFFWDMPIVPMGELRRPAEEQYGEYTSSVARTLGELFEVSPRRVDHAIRGVFGGVAHDILDVLRLGGRRGNIGEASDAPIIGRIFQRGGQLGMRPKSVDEVYTRLAEMEQRAASTRTEETRNERERRLMLDDAARALSALSFVRSQTDDVAKRRELTRKMVELANQALRDASGEGRPPRLPMQQQRRWAERAEEGIKAGR